MIKVLPMNTPYEKWGYSLKQWEALALLTAKLERSGIDVTGINNLYDNDPTAGAELIYSRGKQALLLSASSRTGKVVVAFHRTLDSAIPERVCGGDLSNWNSIASQMLYYRQSWTTQSFTGGCSRGRSASCDGKGLRLKNSQRTRRFSIATSGKLSSCCDRRPSRTGMSRPCTIGR